MPLGVTPVFRVGVVIHAVRAGARVLSAAAMTGVQTANPGLLRRQDVSRTASSWSPAAATGDDAIDSAATTARVLNNHERERFEMWVGDELVGVLGYLDERDAGAPSDRRVVAFMHTVVAEEWTRRGCGAILVRDAFDDARSRDWTVRLACPFARNILTWSSRGDRT